MSDDPRRQVADQLRAIAERLVGPEGDEVTWADASASLADLLDVLPGGSRTRSRFARHSARDVVGADAFAAHPLSTGSTPTYPPLAITIDGTNLTAEVAFGPAWEGPAGTVHGGFLAATFDIALSQLAARHLSLCVTRSLALRYLRPTPLHRPLRLEAVAGERQGRLLDLTARLFVEDRVTMSAQAQFASVPHTG